MRAVILAAGRHQRLQHVTGSTPKTLFPLNKQGDTLLSFLLAGIQQWSVQEIYLVAGERFPLFKQYCETNRSDNLITVRARVDHAKGPLFTFLTVLSHIKDDLTVVIPADFFMAPTAYPLLKKSLGTSGVRLYTHPVQGKQAGHLVIEGRIRDASHVRANEVATALLPILQVSPAFAEFARQKSESGATRLVGVLQSWQDEGNEIGVCSLPDFFWADVDTVEDLTRVRTFLEARQA